MVSQEETRLESNHSETVGNPRKYLWFTLMGVAIIIFVLTLLGVRVIKPIFFSPKVPYKTSEAPSPSPSARPTKAVDTETAALEKQEDSDEIEAIEADLKTTDFSNLDRELTEIESELISP